MNPEEKTIFYEIYEEIYGAVDPLAEIIRTTGEYAPGNFTRFAELSTIEEQNGVPPAEMMLEELLQDKLDGSYFVLRSRPTPVNSFFFRWKLFTVIARISKKRVRTVLKHGQSTCFFGVIAKISFVIVH